MEHNQVNRDNKEHKSPRNRLHFVTDSMEGIPERCVCGKGMIRERSSNEVYDYLPGRRFFTCENYKDDGLHYRQPWVCAIEEQLGILKTSLGRCEEYATRVLKLELKNEELQAELQSVKNSVTDTQGLIPRIVDLEEENQELKAELQTLTNSVTNTQGLIPRIVDLEEENEELKEEVERLIGRVSLLEYSA